MSALPTAAAGDASRGWFGRLKQDLRNGSRAALEPLVQVLARMGVRPDWLTIVGAALSVLAAVAFFEGDAIGLLGLDGFQWGSVFLVLAGVCDILDGQLARAQGAESRFGAFLDSTLDRASEALVFLGIAGYYTMRLLQLAYDPNLVLSQVARGLEPTVWTRLALLALLALVGSFLVSYTRARAEGLGLECRVGWAERPERMVILIAAGLFGVGRAMIVALFLLTFLSFLTAAQRVAYVWRTTRAADGDTDRPGRP